MSILTKPIYPFNANPIKIPMTLYNKTGKNNPKFIWNHKRHQIAKTILNKKTNAGSITISHFKLYYRATVNKIVWYWHKICIQYKLPN
jgi:hypothetical protein